MAKVTVVGKDQEAKGGNGDVSIVTEGTKGKASVQLDGVAICLEGGQAVASKRCVAFVRDGGAPDLKKPSAYVGDGAVAYNVHRGAARCHLHAVAACGGGDGKVDVLGRGSVGVHLSTSTKATGRLWKSGESLLLFPYEYQGKIRWIIGVTGKGSHTVTIQDGLKARQEYRRSGRKLVKA